MPNIVICDLNQEHDNIIQIMDFQFGNSGLTSLLAILLSKNLMYEWMRRELRQNVSFVDNYPLLDMHYQMAYARMDPMMAAIQSKS